MTTITINKRTKAGKTLFDLATILASNNNNGVSIEKKRLGKKIFTAKETDFLNDLKIIAEDCKNIKSGTNKKQFQTLQSFLDEV